MRELKNFKTSDYLEIIKILGINIKPMSYSDIKEKISIPNTSFSRALKWLQNIEDEDKSRKKLKEAYFIKKNNYIEHIGKNKSKNGAFKLTEIGLDVFNSEYLRKYEIEYIEEIIKDFKINKVIWDFISRNKKLFLKNYLEASNNALEPWTIQIFEFFDELNEFQLIQIQESIPGPENMKFFNLLKILSEILIHHPIWKKSITEKGFEVAPYKSDFIATINNSILLKEKLFIIERGDNLVFLLKSDKFIKAIFPLIKSYLKIIYWQENSFYLSKETLIQNIINNVIYELNQDFSEYSNFINDFKLEISYLIKKILIQDLISAKTPIKMPFILMNNAKREIIDFQLKRKLLSSDSDEIPPILLTQGASKDLIKERIDLLVDQYLKDKNNLKNNLSLLEILVYNYSIELRGDFWFYEKWKMSLEPFIQELITESISLRNKYTEQFLTLGFIFFNQKFPNRMKAIEINERLLELYPTDEFLLENLIYLLFSIQQWNIDKIDLVINEALKIYPDSLFFAYSNIILGLVNKNFNDNKDLVKSLTNLFNPTGDLPKFIHIIRFFINNLESHGYNEINLRILEILDLIISDMDFKLDYAKVLEKNGSIVKALKIYLDIIDYFPNNFLESYIFRIFLNNYRRFTEEEKKSEELTFIQKVHEFSEILMSKLEFDVNEGDVSEFEEKRDLFLKEIRSRLKDINQFVKNSICKIIPLKIKALMLKALNREKNLESTLIRILDIAPNNIWAINELGFLYFQQNKFNEGLRLFELAELIKKEIKYNIPYLHVISHSYLYEIHEFNFAELYKRAGKYNQAILVYKDYLIDLNKKLPFNTTAKTLTKDLIICYQKVGLNSYEIVEEILTLLDKIEHAIDIKDQEDNGIFVNRSINLQHDPVLIKNSLIEFLYNEKKYKLCLEYILGFNEETPRVLENIHSSTLSPFNINTIYLAECFLNLNDLTKANTFYVQAYQNILEDIRYKSKVTTNLWFIRPFPDYLKIKEKKYYIKKIVKGQNKINILLEKENILEELIFKTDIEKSIGNISLLVRKRAKILERLFNILQDQLRSISAEERDYYEVILASSYAITGYIDEMFKIINKENFEKAFPIVSSLLKMLYYSFNNDFKKYTELNTKLYQFLPNSSIPNLLNLHYLRFKRGLSEINNITILFKTIWSINPKKIKIHGIEKQIFKYFKNHLTWNPFKWALKVDRYIKTSKNEDVKQLFEIIKFIEEKTFNQEFELLEFITQALNTDRKIPEFLSLLLISKGYEYPETKYHIYNLLNPEIQQYGLKKWGEIAYRANKLDDFLPLLDDYRYNELKKYKEIDRLDWNKKWLEEQYVSFLLSCFRSLDLEDRISKSMKYLERLEDFPKEKLRFFNILVDLRKGYYKGAELKAYQLIKLFKKKPELKWDEKYYTIWVLSKILTLLTDKKEINPQLFLEITAEIIEFEKMKKDPIYFNLLILDVLTHELLAGNETELVTFTEKLFLEIIKMINWSNNKNHDIILEKIYFNRSTISSLSLKIINNLNKLIERINPKRITGRKYYLYKIVAIIYINNNKEKEAKETLEQMFNILPVEFNYIKYGEINDLYLNLQFN